MDLGVRMMRPSRYLEVQDNDNPGMGPHTGLTWAMRGDVGGC